jgi:hypothetical protein
MPLAIGIFLLGKVLESPQPGVPRQHPSIFLNVFELLPPQPKPQTVRCLPVLFSQQPLKRLKM